MIQERLSRKSEAADLRRAFTLLDTKGDGKVDAVELGLVFQKLRHKEKKSEIEGMIWEVDEDCDQCLTWKEFQDMYHRCRNDQTGYEPHRLFNVVQFLMNDKEGKGTVSLEETMQIMYLRYGRQLLDAQLEEIFGTSDLNSGKTLTLTQFLHSLHVSQIRQLNSRVTAKTYQPPAVILKKQVSSV
ncbi:outer dynein arm-docking complex subunit 3 [Coccomyxa subellipsoidea C-169]|uniref:Outer dynein arm-docking complex subunit 3 n=1 Tax=Coccomyxa subellipsoidea (strain C-169) TaxID=574566 RepID=I0Z9J9_COCSC|nr:outer dynein arm-docking complex subunit 3 [Coccomyxa subellipsoidea C-169]EIE27318.1 outer dynein arm-docking complex subunit 3 [Coccomyxa subellipsoidea C-169]|eukprot:XP_005651862.1 outer dynein arm-docking complex subunit 3 [Coccomyxa subellipsoidea C-169]